MAGSQAPAARLAARLGELEVMTKQALEVRARPTVN
jgi:hypothetical protein